MAGYDLPVLPKGTADPEWIYLEAASDDAQMRSLRQEAENGAGDDETAFALMLGLGGCLALLVLLSLYFALSRHLVPEPTAGLAFAVIACVLLFSVVGAYFVRTILWTKPYVIDSKG
jgi:hypothetical protein